MTRPTVQLFVNPGRGLRSRARIRRLRAAFEALDARVLVTESLSDRLAIDDEVDHVCAVGGDGTLRHVVAAVRRAGRPVSVSVYPAGTVNLLAMEYGYPRDPAAFARRVLTAGRMRLHYAARIDHTPLLTCASVGPDSYAVALLSPGLKRLIGRAAYLLAFLKLLTRWKRTAIMIEHDGQQTACEAVYIAKGRFYAGRLSFAPNASAADPSLHVTALREASRTRFLLFAWTLWRRRPVERLTGVQCFVCTELTLRSNDALPLQADGDIVALLPSSITLQPQPLSFV